MNPIQPPKNLFLFIASLSPLCLSSFPAGNVIVVLFFSLRLAASLKSLLPTSTVSPSLYYHIAAISPRSNHRPSPPCTEMTYTIDLLGIISLQIVLPLPLSFFLLLCFYAPPCPLLSCRPSPPLASSFAPPLSAQASSVPLSSVT